MPLLLVKIMWFHLLAPIYEVINVTAFASLNLTNVFRINNDIPTLLAKPVDQFGKIPDDKFWHPPNQ